jgi:pimeloyl-ACP methyl ester carboxylesterase
LSAPAENLPPGAFTARVRGHSLYYRDEGEGTPVLLMHGMGASSHVYDPLVQRRRRGLRFISFDLPCAGRSGRYCPTTIAGVAAEAAALLDRLDVPKAVVVGHSFGGVTAVEMAARFPEKVGGFLVAAAPAVGLPAQVRGLLENPAGAWAMEKFGRMPTSPFLTRTYLKFIFGDRALLTDRMVEGYVAAAQAKDFYPAMLEGLRDLAAYRIPVDRLAEGKIPAVVLWGEKDRLASAAQGEQIARALGGSLRVLEGVGHCIPEERPEELAAGIDELVSKMKRRTKRAKR